jgi:hypothetical protein
MFLAVSMSWWTNLAFLNSCAVMTLGLSFNGKAGALALEL